MCNEWIALCNDIVGEDAAPEAETSAEAIHAYRRLIDDLVEVAIVKTPDVVASGRMGGALDAGEKGLRDFLESLSTEQRAIFDPLVKMISAYGVVQVLRLLGAMRFEVRFQGSAVPSDFQRAAHDFDQRLEARDWA